MDVSTERIVSTCPFHGDISQYRLIIKRWHEYPQYVNRRLSGVTMLYLGQVHLPRDGNSILRVIASSGIHSGMDVITLLTTLKNNGIIIEDSSNISCVPNLSMALKKLLPRNSDVFSPMLELTIFDNIHNNTMFVGLPSESQDTSTSLSPTLPYSINFKDNEIMLTVYNGSEVNDKSVAWLRDTLIPKLQRWSLDDQEKYTENVTSLSLVCVEKYTHLYQELKKKYGHKMVEIWPENTDPLKFVYEDVAIATYLLLLWEIERERCNKPEWQQSFVDLGCGNGLLVYILSSEGHQGVGIDVRRRRIWDMYPTTVQLKVETFNPSNCSLFPEADWIIGNHSDELTPWIPVIAARSSFNCNFFLLPCCAYEFSGCKYKRIDSSRSQYSEYLDYVKHICVTCGFKFSIDRLKIPSTKRVCLVSFARNYPKTNLNQKEKEIEQYIEKRCRETQEKYVHVATNESCDLTSESQTSLVKLRNSVEQVRNCTQLPKDVISQINKHVVKCLLEDEHRIPIVNDKGEKIMWNAGGCVNLSEIVTSLPQALLNELKKECGGLQTLLRNNHQVFAVSNGKVKLSVMNKKQERKQRAKKGPRSKEMPFKIKQKPCWFFEFHPDGCPLKNEECTFCH